MKPCLIVVVVVVVVTCIYSRLYTGITETTDATLGQRLRAARDFIFVHVQHNFIPIKFRVFIG